MSSLPNPAHRLLSVALLLCAAAVIVPSPRLVSALQIPAGGPKASSAHLTPEENADLLVIHQRYLDAIADYKQVTPQTAAVLNKLGMAYEHMFMTKDAKAAYQQALRLDPKYSPVFNNLGTVFYGEHDYRQAEKLYKRAIKLDPQSASSYHNLGTLYFACKKGSKGARAFQQAFSLDPHVFDNKADGIPQTTSMHDLAAVNYTLAKTYAQAGMKDQAIQHLRRAFGEGFKDSKKVREEKEFATLRGMPEFERLMTEEGIR